MGRKFGEGHLAAYLRSGAKEVTQVLPAFPAQGIQPVEENGLAGNAVQAEVANQRGVDSGGQARSGERSQDQGMEQ